MYIREIQKKNPSSPKTFISHRLIESVRTPRGPRQRAVLNLGRLDLPREQWKALANRIEELLHGYEQVTVPVPDEIETLARHYAKQILRKRRSEEKETHILEDEQDFREVDVNALASSDCKSVGPEHAGLAAMKALEFFTLFRRLGFSEDESNLPPFRLWAAWSIRAANGSSNDTHKSKARWTSSWDAIFSAVGHNVLYRNAIFCTHTRQPLSGFSGCGAGKSFPLARPSYCTI